MPTHDYIIANGTGAAVRADINLALSAIVSLNSSASEPATMYAYQLWADTALGLLKIRNSTNSGWVTLRQLDGDFSIVAVEDGLLATPSLTFTTDLNTGIFRPSTDALGIVTGGQYAIACTSTQAVGIRTANPSAALHVAGVARIGADDTTDAVLEIGSGATGNREAYIDLVGDTTYFDYGARFGRSAGANGITYFAHRGTGAISIQTTEAGPITFSTTGTERLRLSGSGDFVFKGAGTTPGTDKAVFFSTAAPINSMVLDSSGRLLVGASSGTGAGITVEMQYGGINFTGGGATWAQWGGGYGIFPYAGVGLGIATSAAIGFVGSTGGNIASINGTTGVYTPLSDARKKKDFEDSNVGLAEVLKLKPKLYRMLDDANDAPKELGFIAQEVKLLIPQAYVENKITEDNTFIGLQDRPIIAVLVKGMQEQQAIITALEARLFALESA